MVHLVSNGCDSCHPFVCMVDVGSGDWEVMSYHAYRESNNVGDWLTKDPYKYGSRS